ncbi:hypothetical protein FSP39_018466 [Pinctada imbricata]|uniref:Tyrosine-protein kinase receptor n=1 Tax=Pinctada imbricata TaxID=66713 RepID=A0AA88Y824_PINIB|nr:hypothetical protein FSP39_018466 [Pinctada imbricata]
MKTDQISICILAFVLLETLVSSEGEGDNTKILFSGRDLSDCTSGRVIKKVFLEVLCGNPTSLEEADWRSPSPDPGICYVDSTKTNTGGHVDNITEVQVAGNCNRKNKSKDTPLCITVPPRKCNSSSTQTFDVTSKLLSTFVNGSDESIQLQFPAKDRIRDIRIVFITKDISCNFDNKCEWSWSSHVQIKSNNNASDWCKSCDNLTMKMEGFSAVVSVNNGVLTSPSIHRLNEPMTLRFLYFIEGTSELVVNTNSSEGQRDIWHSENKIHEGWQEAVITLPPSKIAFTINIAMLASTGNESLLAIRNISTRRKNTDLFDHRYGVSDKFCDFGEPCQFIEAVEGGSHFNEVKGDPSRRLLDTVKAKFGSFMYTDGSKSTHCFEQQMKDGLVERLKSKVLVPSNRPCKISFAWYGDAWWDLSIFAARNDSIRRKYLGQHDENEQRRIRKTTYTVPNVSYPYLIEFSIDEAMHCDYIGLDYIFLSDGCVFQTDVVELNVTLKTEMVVSNTDMEQAHSSFKGFIIPLALVTAFLFLVGLIITAVIKRRRETKHSSLLQGGKARERSVAVVDLLAQQTIESAIQEILTEKNPNYEWFSERLLNGTIKDYDRSRIRTDSIIGKGAFGEVYRGTLLASNENEKDIQIAVKQLPNGAKENSKSDFLFEALTLCKFQHKNIVRCLGISTDNYGIYILLEMMAGGDLRSYLRQTRDKETKRSTLQIREMLSLALDIASGCQYLESNKFVHRDIAARNCLLTSKSAGKQVKIGDFGLARDIVMSDYYRKEGQALLPVRWMSPETFQDGIFSSKSDVWAYGILLWEIFSSGFIPYPGLSNFSVLNFVTSGGRLESPAVCPSYVYNTMLWCWADTPEKRPTFTQVIEDLELANRIYVDCSVGVHKRKTKQSHPKSPRYYTKSSVSDDSSTLMLIDEICKNGV